MLPGPVNVTELAAIAYAIATAIVIAFQVALALGAPGAPTR